MISHTHDVVHGVQISFGFTGSVQGQCRAHGCAAAFYQQCEGNTMNRRSILTMTAVGMISFCAGSIARADEVLKFRVVLHATSVQSQEVGDVDGHALGLAHYSALASFPDGSVGTANFTATTDYIKGTGTYSVYYNLTLKDGSVLWYKSTGAAKLDGTTTIFPEASVSVLRGTLRFEGAKGDGTLTGARLAPLAVGADLYADIVINVKK
jgi:hypothetical protein